MMQGCLKRKEDARRGALCTLFLGGWAGGFILVVLMVFVGAAVAAAREGAMLRWGDGKTGNWYDLIADYQGQAVSSSGSVEQRLILATAYANTGQLTRAFEIFQQLGQQTDRAFAQSVINKYADRTRQDPNDLLGWNLQAFAWYSLTGYDQAVRCFNQVLRLDPNNVWPREFLALSLASQDRLDDAIDVLENALKLDEGNQYTHLLLAMGYYRKRNYSLALWHLAHAPKAAAELARYGVKVGS
ncbi:MAG: tetratricopeptide repeat protein [Limnochordaceae bacterium]|nr:tetratricopeptide repeat protein [Limnochordaceae bacterium]